MEYSEHQIAKTHTMTTVYLLMLGVFCVGTAEIVVSGLLPLVSGDLHVSVFAAGMLVTVYAVGVTIAGPIVTLVTTAVRRHILVFGLLAIFALGNVITFLAPSYGLIMVARLITSFTHGTYVALAFGIAGEMASVDKQGSAMARIALGFNLANALGGPLGAFIGENLGWRTTFLYIAIFSIVILIALICFVPRDLPTPEKLSYTIVKDEARELTNRAVNIAVIITILTQAAVFASSTYIVALLEDVANFSPSIVPILLVIFGIGAICGNFIGGKIADIYPQYGSVLVIIAVIIGSIVLWFGLFSKFTAVLALFILGATGFSIIPALQARVLSAAKYAPTLALSLNVSAFNLGNGLGALAGGAMLDLSNGDSRLIPLTGVMLAAVSLIIALLYSIQVRNRQFCTQ